MVKRNHLLLPAIFAALLPASLFGQASSARDRFWSASDLISVTPNPAVRPHPRVHANSPAKSPSGAPSSNSPASPQDSRENQVSELVAMNGYGAAPHLVRASENHLGLRCSIMRRGADKEYTEVAPDTVFHSGDHIRLSFLANEPGYFYVIQQGSSGAWSPVYPPINASPDATKIEAGKLQIVPTGTRTFAFDQNPGNEKLYIILSRTPIDDIDRAIRNLSSGHANPTPDSASSGAELEATNVIPDAFVKQLATRDLVLVDEEKVDDTSTHGNEKAIYVVNKGNAPDASSQIVLKLDLRHE